MSVLNFGGVGIATGTSGDNSLTAYRIGSLKDNDFQWNFKGLESLGILGNVIFNKTSLKGMSLITDKKGNYEIAVTKNGNVVGSINVINNHKGIVNFASPIQFETGSEINFKTIRNYASLGRVIANPTLQKRGIQQFNSLDNYSNNVPDTFLFQFTMPNTFDDRNRIIFETGNTASGVTIYHNRDKLQIFIGSFEGLDFDIANVFQAGKSYILLVELILENNQPIANVYVGEVVNGNFPKTLTKIETKKYNGTIDWTADDDAGLGTIGASGSFKGGLLKFHPDPTWRQSDSEVFKTSNGRSNITHSTGRFVNPEDEQASIEQAIVSGSSGHYRLIDSNKEGIILDYSFSRQLPITGTRITQRTLGRNWASRAASLFIKLLLNGNVVYTSPKFSDSRENTFPPVQADQIQLVSNLPWDPATRPHIQFNYIEVQRYTETILQMDNFNGSDLNFQFFSDKNKDGVWENGTDKADPTKAIVRAYFK